MPRFARQLRSQPSDASRSVMPLQPEDLAELGELLERFEAVAKA